MADEVKKDPLLKLLETINSSNTGLAREMFIKNPELVLLKNSQNQNALRSIIATKNYELFEHVWQDEKMHKAILDLANNDNISFIVLALIEVRGRDFFEYILQKLNPKERSSLFYNKQNTFNLCALEFLVATRPDYKKTLVENNIFSQEQIDKIAKIANARTFLKFAYSPLGFFQGTDLVCRLQRFLVRDIAEASDLKFLEALKIISDETTTQVTDSFKVNMVNLGYVDHDAYGAIIYGQDGRPQFFSYIDSYIPNAEIGKKYNFGECCFRLKPELRDLFIDDLREEVFRVFEGQHAFEQNAEEANKKLAQLVVCDENSAPIVVSQSIPTQKQEFDRENCSYKSTNIAMRFLVQKTHPEMVYELGENGEPRGDLYDEYKRFRRKITDHAMQILRQQLLETSADSDEFDKMTYKAIVADFNEMLKKARGKKDISRVDLLRSTLQSLDSQGLGAASGKALQANRGIDVVI